MAELKVRRLYTDSNNPFEKKKSDESCRHGISILHEYGLSFLDGFESRKEKLGARYVIKEGCNEGLLIDLFEKEFYNNHRAKIPYLLLTPVGVTMFYTTPEMDPIMIGTAGRGHNMLAVVDPCTLIREHSEPEFHGVVLHELLHSVYKLSHHNGPRCMMRSADYYDSYHICKDCRIKARKVDEELRGS